VHESGDVIGNRAKIGLALPQLQLGTFAVIDVRKKEIPCSYRIFRISGWEATNLEPLVHSVNTPRAVLNLIDLSRFDRLFPCLDYARKVVRMNDIGQGPVPTFQLLICFAKILQDLMVKKLRLPGWTRRTHESGNIVDDLSPGELVRLQPLFGTLAVIDVDIDSAPADKIAVARRRSAPQISETIGTPRRHGESGPPQEQAFETHESPATLLESFQVVSVKLVPRPPH
jgi:hypothetical protein